MASDQPPDPRDRVTEQAFRVAPELLGRPIAAPWRRLLALLLDLLLATLVARLLGTIVLAAVGVTFLRAYRRPGSHGVWTSGRRFGQLGAGVFALLLAAIFVFAKVRVDVGPEVEVDLKAEDVSKLEPDERELLEALGRLLPGEAGEELRARLEAATTTSTGTEAERLAHEKRAEDLARCMDELAAERRRGRSAADYVESLMDSAGLTVGWVGAYFTLLLVWGRGRTPAKRLLGLRVVRLDDRPIGYWDAFERFSGYGAGLATGMLGFLQVYWDPNRQAIHDKITRTVVLREDRPPDPPEVP